jgi:uncharacterized YceG family protein
MFSHSSFSDAAVAGRKQKWWHRKYDASSMSYSAPEHGFAHAEPQRRRGVGRRIVSIVLLLLALAVIGGVVLLALTWKSSPDVKAGKRVRVTIPKNANAQDIAGVLADAGVIKNENIFVARLRMNGDGGAFRSGSYSMKTLSGYDTIVKQLEAGPPPPAVFNVTVPEGYRITQMAKLVEDLRDQRIGEGSRPLPAFTGKQYTAAVKRARSKVPARYAPPRRTRSMEGMLFPATFELRKVASADDLVERQLDAYVQTMDSLDLRRARKANLTPYEVVIIASMIEREARVPADRPKIAAVIYNRLRARMTLGIDATIQYAVSKQGWKTQLTESDLAIDSPYNTRLRVGLPPTPIASPGLASLKAAANPGNYDYLYYVADPAGSGKHHFSVSYTDFLNDPYQQG